MRCCNGVLINPYLLVQQGIWYEYPQAIHILTNCTRLYIIQNLYLDQFMKSCIILMMTAVLMMTGALIMTGFLAELIVDLLSEYVCNQNDISIIFSGLLVYPEHTLD